MLFARRLNRTAFFLLLMACASPALCDRNERADPSLADLESSAVEFYRTRGLLPEPNSLALRRSAASVAGRTAQPTSASRCLSAAGSYELDLTPVKHLRNERVVITNVSEFPVVNPWVVANGCRNWFSCDSIVREALGGESDPERKAFRIWELVRRARYHWYPAEAGLELHSPVKFLNVYGYGYCDDCATNLELLWKLAGFPNARCYGLNGHVVSEVHYGGAWHVLDADLEVVYPLRDGTGAAGVHQLASDGDLVSRLTPEFTQFYTSQSDNTFYVGWWDSASSMAMTLRPGESLERCHYNWGKHHDNLYHKPPPFYGNGRQTWTPDLRNPSQSWPGFAALENIGWDDAAAGPEGIVRPQDPAVTASLVWSMSSAYVFVGGTANFHLIASGAATSAEVHFRKAGGEWQHLTTVSAPHDGWTSVPLDAAIAPLSTDACYSFDLKLVLEPDRADPESIIGLNGLSTTGEIQCNPRSLPALVAGPNVISTTFLPTQEAQLEVTFEWSDSNDSAEN